MNWLVVGLGNPGAQYAGNRHNVGFMIVDLIAKRLGARFGRHNRAMAEVAEARLGLGGDAPKLVLAKPRTYMNLSGGPVASLAQFYKIEPGQVIAVHDDRIAMDPINVVSRMSSVLSPSTPRKYSAPTDGIHGARSTN